MQLLDEHTVMWILGGLKKAKYGEISTNLGDIQGLGILGFPHSAQNLSPYSNMIPFVIQTLIQLIFYDSCYLDAIATIAFGPNLFG